MKSFFSMLNHITGMSALLVLIFLFIPPLWADTSDNATDETEVQQPCTQSANSSRLEDLEAELARMRLQTESLISRLEYFEARNVDHQQTATELQASQQDYAQLHTVFVAKEQDLAQLQQRNDELASEHASLQQALELAREENTRLNALLADAKSQAQRLESTLLEMRSEHTQIYDRLTQLQQNMDQQTEQRKHVEDSWANEQATVAAQRQQITALESAKQQAQQALTQATTKLAEMTAREQRQAATIEAQTDDLAHLEQTLTKLGAESDLVRTEKLRLEAALDAAQQHTHTLQATIAQLEQENATLLNAKGNAETALQQTQTQLTHTQTALQQRDDELDEQTALMRDALSYLADIEMEFVQTQRNLQNFKSLVAPGDGGTAEKAEIKVQAGIAAQHFQAIRRQHASRPTAELGAQLQQAIATLRKKQFLMARLEDAKGVYQVRGEDTLARIAVRFYGDGNQWRRIADANAYMLEDPNLLHAGLTLIIP